VVERLDSEWAMGSCHSVTVTNTGDAPVTWSLTLTVTGTLSQNWSSNATASGSDVTFTGVDYNATLGPGESTNFGYCVSR
jgi:endoglucanase